LGAVKHINNDIINISFLHTSYITSVIETLPPHKVAKSGESGKCA